MVDLRRDSEQVRALWRSSADSHVPLPLAAALAFHESRRGAASIMARVEYEAGLDLSAAALSRLVPIYACDQLTRVPVMARFDLGAGRFRDGAAAYELADGTAMTPLLVAREGLMPAVALIRSTGIPFQLAGVYSA